jgi:hypothetical protein
LGVTGVFAQLVEVDEVATRSIHKKTKDLWLIRLMSTSGYAGGRDGV